MGNRENVSGCGLGDEVKKIGKDVMETQSCEYGFICYWSKYENVWVKEFASWTRVPCVKWRMSYLQFVVILFVAKKQKRTEMLDEM